MPNENALVTPYESAPGHTPSLSAYCHANGIVFGSHPWNRHQAQFQIFHNGKMVLNEKSGLEQHWTFPLGDYTIRYADKSYEVRQDRCDTQSTTTSTPSTTSTSEPPTVTTETTVSPTTIETTSTTTASTVPVAESVPPSSSTTMEIPVDTTQPPVVTTWLTTPEGSTTSLVALVSPPTTDPVSELPHTGFEASGLLYAGAALCMIGVALKRRFGKV